MAISEVNYLEMEKTFADLQHLLEVIRRQVVEKARPDIIFHPGCVPVKVAAKVYGESENWIRAGIISGYCPIGTATRNGKEILNVQDMDSRKGKISYHISPKLLYEQTGYLWKGEKQ